MDGRRSDDAGRTYVEHIGVLPERGLRRGLGTKEDLLVLSGNDAHVERVVVGRAPFHQHRLIAADLRVHLIRAPSREWRERRSTILSPAPVQAVHMRWWSESG